LPAGDCPHRAPADYRTIPARADGRRLGENAPAAGQPRDARAITEGSEKQCGANFGERAALVDVAKQGWVISNIAFTFAHQQVIYNVSLAFYATLRRRLTSPPLQNPCGTLTRMKIKALTRTAEFAPNVSIRRIARTAANGCC